MIKEKILKFEGKRKDKTKFGPIRAAFVKKNAVFEKTRQNVKAGSQNPKVSNQRRERPL
jgi:hypothetical protein